MDVCRRSRLEHDTYQFSNGELSSQKDLCGGIHFQLSAWPLTDVPSQTDGSVKTASTPEADWQAAYDFMKTFHARYKALEDQMIYALTFYAVLEARYYRHDQPETYDDGMHLHGFCCQLLLQTTT